MIILGGVLAMLLVLLIIAGIIYVNREVMILEIIKKDVDKYNNIFNEYKKAQSKRKRG